MQPLIVHSRASDLCSLFCLLDPRRPGRVVGTGPSKTSFVGAPSAEDGVADGGHEGAEPALERGVGQRDHRQLPLGIDEAAMPLGAGERPRPRRLRRLRRRAVFQGRAAIAEPPTRQGGQRQRADPIGGHLADGRGLQDG